MNSKDTEPFNSHSDDPDLYQIIQVVYKVEPEYPSSKMFSQRGDNGDFRKITRFGPLPQQDRKSQYNTRDPHRTPTERNHTHPSKESIHINRQLSNTMDQEESQNQQEHDVPTSFNRAQQQQTYVKQAQLFQRRARPAPLDLSRGHNLNINPDRYKRATRDFKMVQPRTALFQLLGIKKTRLKQIINNNSDQNSQPLPRSLPTKTTTISSTSYRRPSR